MACPSLMSERAGLRGGVWGACWLWRRSGGRGLGGGLVSRVRLGGRWVGDILLSGIECMRVMFGCLFVCGGGESLLEEWR